jgi:ubiquinone/menaquinone biosynthesis C-methylase UbiE
MSFNRQTKSVTKKNGRIVTNVLYSDSDLATDNSMLTGPASTCMLFEAGSFNFTMNWADLFKHEYQFSQTRHFKNPTVLDLGCRSGEYRTICYRNLQHIQYTGVDLNPSCIKRLFNFFTTENSNFYLMNLSNRLLPFDDESFDVVLMNDIIEHLDSREAGLMLLSEGLRVAKQIAFIVTPNNSDQQNGQQKLLYPNDHKYEYSMSQIEGAILDTQNLISEKFGIVSLKKVIDAELKKHPEIKTIFDRTMIKSNFLRNTLISQMFPETAKDVLYVVRK